ncbi:transposase [Mesorhizobium amorphae CCBAU 01583]|nr:transposase [Mesorhizobium amorphae CCBAU 01583]
MEEISTVGIELAKSAFQIHAIDGAGKALVRHQLRRHQMLNFSRAATSLPRRK